MSRRGNMERPSGRMITSFMWYCSVSVDRTNRLGVCEREGERETERERKRQRYSQTDREGGETDR